MKVEKFTYNDFDDLFANTYVVIDDNNAIVIDPSVDNNNIGDYLSKNKLTLKAVLLTHGHFDHMRGADRLVKRFSCPLYIHFDDEVCLKDEYLNCSLLDGISVIVDSKPITIVDNEILSILNDEIKVIHTPFHTKGSVCYYFINNKWLFSGDTLFARSIGRDDLPGNDKSKKEESLKKIKALPKEVKIFPGHGANTTLESELTLNNFLQ